MVILTRPDEIVVEFLKARLTDPRGRYTSSTDNFVATAGQTVFTLTPATVTNLVRAIRTVTVDGTAQSKWQDYTIDLKNKQVTLLTGATLSDAVVVTYYDSASGGDWIYPDMPIATMGKTKFPRVSVEIVNKMGARNGSYQSDISNLVHFQIDVWTKEGYSKTYDGKNYTEQDLAEYLAHQTESAFIDYIDDLYPKLYDYDEAAFNNMSFDEASQTFRHKQEFILSGVNVGH